RTLICAWRALGTQEKALQFPYGHYSHRYHHIHEAARRMLRPEDCALAVIDIQEKLLPPIFEKERLVRNAQLLVRLADILSLPVIVSTQYEKGLGKTVEEISSLLPDMKPLDKLEFGCF